MKIHTVFITYNRLELTKRALESYVETVTVDYRLLVVDNGSTDGTVEWVWDDFLQRDLDHFRISEVGENKYPGYATNLGWDLVDNGYPATHLHRADNDFVFLPGWCDEVERCFEHVRKLGQLGLRTREEENSSINVGGNCVVSRKLWDRGIRWDERPWPRIRDEVGIGWTEDSLFSQAVRDHGWNWARVRKPCIQPISSESLEDPYYQQTWADRGLE